MGGGLIDLSKVFLSLLTLVKQNKYFSHIAVTVFKTHAKKFLIIAGIISQCQKTDTITLRK